MRRPHFSKKLLRYSCVLLIATSSCQLWNQTALPPRSDKTVALGTVRITTLDDRKIILQNALVTRNEIRGISAETGVPTAVLTDSVRMVEKKGNVSEPGPLRSAYLGGFLILGALIGLALYH